MDQGQGRTATVLPDELDMSGDVMHTRRLGCRNLLLDLVPRNLAAIWQKHSARADGAELLVPSLANGDVVLGIQRLRKQAAG